MRTAFLVGLLVLSGATRLLAEELVLRGTSIKAMDGLPTVTFVVPWQTLQPSPYITMPTNSVLDDYMSPVDATFSPAVLNNHSGAHTVAPDNKQQ